MQFPRRRGVIPRFQQHLRYQSRFGHERFKLVFGLIAIVATGIAITFLFAH